MALEQDTIVAISTPVGRGGIGVVRLSGMRALAAAAPLLRLRHPAAAGRARFGEIVDVATGDVRTDGKPLVFACPGATAKVHRLRRQREVLAAKAQQLARLLGGREDPVLRARARHPTVVSVKGLREICQ